MILVLPGVLIFGTFFFSTFTIIYHVREATHLDRNFKCGFLMSRVQKNLKTAKKLAGSQFTIAENISFSRQ